MHRVARLESDDAGPVEFCEVRAEFGGSETVFDVVVVVETVDGLKGAAYVVFLGFVVEVVDCWVGKVVRTEYVFGFFDFVGSVDILD